MSTQSQTYGKIDSNIIDDTLVPQPLNELSFLSINNTPKFEN